MKRVFLLSIIFFLINLSAIAQNKTVRGTVTDAITGEPLIGVNVLLPEIGKGVMTNQEGNFKIIVPENAINILFIYPGKARKKVEVAQQAFISVELGPIRTIIDETAHFSFGEKREKYLQPYAYQEIHSSSIAQKGSQNLATLLKGKASSLIVNETSAMPGSSASLSIRGNNSVFIDNEPLIVIDGLPLISGSAFSGLSNGMDYSSRINDINPEDIKSINILKGASAAALYGSRGSNGAIIINTFSGENIKVNSTRINLGQSYMVNKVVGLPQQQNKFGQGMNGQSVDDSPYSWGPNIGDVIDGELNDNLTPLFQNGYTAISNLDISGRNHKGNYNLTLSYADQKGIIPNSGMNRINGKLRGELKLNKKLSIGAIANLGLNDISKLAGGNNSSSVLNGAYLSPPSYDLWGGSFVAAGNPNQQEYYHDGADNPRWSLANNQFNETTQKIFGNVYMKYKPIRWLELNYRGGGEFLTEDINEVYAIGSSFSNGRTMPPSGGRITSGQNMIRQINSNFNAKLKFGNPKEVAFDLLLGNEFVDTQTESIIQQGFEITEAGTDDVNNTANLQSDSINFNNSILGFYANARLSLHQTLYIDLAGRQEYNSNSTFDNSQYFNPTAGLSFVFSQLFEENDFLKIGKLSTSFSKIAQVAYLNQNIFNGFNQGISNSYFSPIRTGFPLRTQEGSFTRNDVINPQVTQTIDVGLNLELFNSQVSLQLNYFQEKNSNQILFLPLPPSSGLYYSLQNAGEIQNTGLESQLSISPVKTKNFEWNISGNYTAIESKVLSVAEGMNSISLGDNTESPEIRLIEGSAFPVLYGNGFLRNEENRIIVDNREFINGNANPGFGMPLRDPNPKELGKMNPDFWAALSNDFRIFGFNLFVQFDGQFGGNAYNGNSKSMKEYGMDIATIDREDGIVLDAVKGYYALDGDGNAVPDVEGENNIVINKGQYFWSEVVSGIDEAHIYKTNFIRLREAKISYTFNHDNSRDGFIKKASIYVVGRNLWMKSRFPNADPETQWIGTSPYYGQQYFNFPQMRSFGGGFNLTF
ncbi:SusC/RagA family TonB-linked outer membrane protein [Marivirga sp.]|uniref:SusC/RagA family TonB-linked outer membrane protein n=1 Tax=Marivirga sp. TaxID=2018662 RepID=UPI0025D488D2|nr:SusC/RagA family TonB-linked outer membrane protein [Marivirga sp.]